MKASREKVFYYLIGGVPLREKGASFVTPVFGRRDTKDVYLQCTVNDINQERFVPITSNHGLTNEVYKIASNNRLLLTESDQDIFGYVEPGMDVHFARPSDLADHLIYTRASRRAEDAHKRMVKSFIERHAVDRGADIEVDAQNLQQWITNKSPRHLIDIALKNRAPANRLRAKYRSEALFFLTATYLTDPVISERTISRHSWLTPQQRISSGKALSLKSALEIVAKSVEFFVGLIGGNPRVDLSVSRLVSGAIYNAIVPSIYYIKSDFFKEFSYEYRVNSRVDMARIYTGDKISHNYDDLLMTMNMCSAYRKQGLDETVSLMTRDTAETIYRYLLDLKGYSSAVKFSDVFDDDLDRLEAAGLKIKALDTEQGNIVKK